MSLFFDKDWFDEKLRATGLAQDDLARALGLTPRQLQELWKDQRELSANDVRILAALLGISAVEIAQRAGISTPVPGAEESPLPPAIVERLDRIEQILLALRREIETLKKS